MTSVQTMLTRQIQTIIKTFEDKRAAADRQSLIGPSGQDRAAAAIEKQTWEDAIALIKKRTGMEG